MPLVDEAAGKGARPGVEVLVGAPGREVDVPVVEGHGHIAGGMREVPADVGADLVTRGRDRGHVHPLSGEVIHRTEEHDGDLVTEFADLGDDVLGAQDVLALAGAHADDVLVGIEAVPAHLRSDGVAIGGEDDVLHDHLGARAARPVEGREHQVDVDGQGIHHDDLVRERTYESCGGLGESLVVVLPRPRPGQLTLDTPRGPSLELHEQCLTCAPGLESE